MNLIFVERKKLKTELNDKNILLITRNDKRRLLEIIRLTTPIWRKKIPCRAYKSFENGPRYKIILRIYIYPNKKYTDNIYIYNTSEKERERER